MRRPHVQDQKVGDQIGKLLRQTYDDVLREPLPDLLMDLLERLERETTPFAEEPGRAKATAQQ